MLRMRSCCQPDCTKAAEFSIFNTSPGADPYDDTESCLGCVGDLLGSNDPTRLPAVSWTVSVIRKVIDGDPAE